MISKTAKNSKMVFEYTLSETRSTSSVILINMQFLEVKTKAQL